MKLFIIIGAIGVLFVLDFILMDKGLSKRLQNTRLTEDIPRTEADVDKRQESN